MSLIVERSEKVDKDSGERGEDKGTLKKQGCDHRASKGNGGGTKGRGESAGRDQEG